MLFSTYALLQGYAERFEIMRAKEEFGLNLEKIAHLWNQGSVIRSWLLERFRSRQDESLGPKVIAALRNEFGGHGVN